MKVLCGRVTRLVIEIYMNGITTSPKQLRIREDPWGGSWVGKTGSRRTETAYKAAPWGETAPYVDAHVIQGEGKCSGCPAKEYVLIRGDLFLRRCEKGIYTDHLLVILRDPCGNRKHSTEVGDSFFQRTEVSRGHSSQTPWRKLWTW